eukprot:311894_1
MGSAIYRFRFANIQHLNIITNINNSIIRIIGWIIINISNSIIRILRWITWMMKIASCIFNVFIDDNNRYNLEEMQLILCGWESYISFQSFKNYEKLLPQSPTPSNHKKHKKKKKHKSNKVGVDKHKYNNNNNNELDRIVPVDIATATPGNAHAPVAHFGGIIQSV